MLLDTAMVASDSLLIGPDAIKASADQLQAVGLAGLGRLDAHPCPDEDLADRLAVLIDRYGAIGRSLQVPADEEWGYVPAVAAQLQALIADLAIFLADLGHAIEGR